MVDNSSIDVSDLDKYMMGKQLEMHRITLNGIFQQVALVM